MTDPQKVEYLRNTGIDFDYFGINSFVADVYRNLIARRDAELKVSRPEVKQQKQQP